MAVALVLRLYRLEMKPLHHDEGVNGFFFTRLFRESIYVYDPANYHGPTLYYLTLPFAGTLGLNTLALRLTTVLFGVATVWLVLHLRRYISSIGALTAAALVAVSPGAVYLSRYYIHESLFVFFTLAVVVAALHYYEGADADAEQRYDLLAGIIGMAATITLVLLSLHLAYLPLGTEAWVIKGLKFGLIFSLVITIVALYIYAGAASIHLIFAFIAAALLFATKETAFISVGVIVLATLVAHGFVWMRKESVPSSSKARGTTWREVQLTGGKSLGRNEITARNRFGDWPQFALALLIAAGLFLFVYILSYSSLFTNAKGIGDSLETFAIWTQTGKSDFHRKGFDAYFWWLWQEEAALLVLGAIGAGLAVWRAGRNRRFPLFAAAWAFGLLTAYSLVPYKTPWLALNFIIPLAITSGYAINEISKSSIVLASSNAVHFSMNHVLALALVVANLALGVFQTVRLNFVYYDDERYPYVYAHTQRGMLELVERIDALARRAGTESDTHIAIYSPDYWPLPWYLRAYDPNVGFHGRMITPSDEAIIILSSEQARDNSSLLLGLDYQQIGSYPLRPGVTLVLYAQRELVDR